MTTKLEELALKELEDEYLVEFKEVLERLLNTTPGEHPDIPEDVHRALRVVYATCEYALQKTEALVQALVEHAVDQRITESAYHRLLIGRKIFTPEEFQRILVQTTEMMGGDKAGTA